MLTNLEEKSRVKADQYWPSDIDVPTMEGKVEITLLKSQQRAGFVVRQFKLRKTKKGTSKANFFLGEFLREDRLVWQLHYTEWPDFGAPDSTEEMTELLRELDIRKKGLSASDPRAGRSHCRTL